MLVICGKAYYNTTDIWLKNENKQAVNVMLYYSVDISRSHWYKEQFLKILSNQDPEKAKRTMIEWIESAENCGIPQFEKCADTMRNWYKGIVNSFSTSITNGFTEGFNKYDDTNHCKAIIDNKLCTAVYNPFSGLFYVDDKYGVIDYIEPQDIKNGEAESE